MPLLWLLVPPAHLIMLMSSRAQRRLVLPWIGAMVIAGMLWLAWVGPIFFRQLHVPGNLSRYGDRWTLQFIVTPLAFSLGRTFAWRDSPSWLLGGAMLISALAFIAPARLLLVSPSPRTIAAALLAAWLALPFVLPLAAALAGKPLFHHRAASVALPAFLLLLAHGLILSEARIRAVLCIVILSTTGISVWRYATVPLKDDWRDATPVILHARDAGGPILFDTGIEIVSIDYYIRSPQVMPALTFGLNDGLTRDGVLHAEKYDNGNRIDWSSLRLHEPDSFFVKHPARAMCAKYARKRLCEILRRPRISTGPKMAFPSHRRLSFHRQSHDHATDSAITPNEKIGRVHGLIMPELTSITIALAWLFAGLVFYTYGIYPMLIWVISRRDAAAAACGAIDR